MVDSYPVFPVFALLSCFLVLIPLPWHLQALNSGTCLYMIWTAMGCLNQFINSIIWHGNIIDRAPLWCDISTRLMVGIAVAIPSASLCINRRLYKIATCQTATITHAQKKRAIIIDLSIGLGIPALQMILQFVVQGHRYDIYGDIGCLPTTVNTPPAYPLSFLWPIIISLVSAVYCILTLKAFMKRRAQFTQFLSSATSLSVDRYFRLMCLATTEIFLTIPMSSYGLYLNISSKPIYPWTSWSDTHFDFYIIDTITAEQWRSSKLFTAILEFNRWSVVICALIFFAFFGFAEEARRNYRALYWFIATRFGAVSPSARKHSVPQKICIHPLEEKINSKGTLSTLVDQKQESSTPLEKRPSISSFNSRETTYTCDRLDAYSSTLYASPAHAKFDVEFPKTPDSSRFSHVSV